MALERKSNRATEVDLATRGEKSGRGRNRNCGRCHCSGVCHPICRTPARFPWLSARAEPLVGGKIAALGVARSGHPLGRRFGGFVLHDELPRTLHGPPTYC